MSSSTESFYNDLAQNYHLIYKDWDDTIEKSGKVLHDFIRQEWQGRIQVVWDASCGIGTQALGLAQHGYQLWASDVSPLAVERCRKEVASRKLSDRISRVFVGDLRHLDSFQQEANLVLAWDNALPHLLKEEDLDLALRACYACTRPGGGCLFSVRNYENESREKQERVDYGTRHVDGEEIQVYQTRQWTSKDRYSLQFHFEKKEQHITAQGGEYRAYTVEEVLEKMRNVGYQKVRRVDAPFFQPALVGHRIE